MNSDICLLFLHCYSRMRSSGKRTRTTAEQEYVPNCRFNYYINYLIITANESTAHSRKQHRRKKIDYFYSVTCTRVKYLNDTLGFLYYSHSAQLDIHVLVIGYCSSENASVYRSAIFTNNSTQFKLVLYMHSVTAKIFGSLHNANCAR